MQNTALISIHKSSKTDSDIAHHWQFLLVWFADQSTLSLLILHIDINQHRLPDALYFRNDAFQIECFRKDDLEDLLHINGRGRWTEDEWCVHGTSKSLCLGRNASAERKTESGMDTDLLCNFFLFIPREGCKCVELCSDQERYRSLWDRSVIATVFQFKQDHGLTEC